MAIRQETTEVAVDAPTPASTPDTAGSMTITFRDYDGTLIPEVSFDPVGRITPNAIERHLPHIYREINVAQNRARRS